MGIKIQHPSPGRVVHYHDLEGRVNVAFVDSFRADSQKGPASIDLFFLAKPAGFESMPSGTGRDAIHVFVRDVPHSADGDRASWRYPPPEKREIEI